jgi:hypothetical protein
VSLPDGTPVPCRCCGAPTELEHFGVVCRFCGTRDALPPDELGRVLEVRGRLALAASRVAQLGGSEAALASIFERRGAFLSVMGPWPLLAVLVVAYSAFRTYTILDALPASVPDAVRVELVIAAAYGPFFVLGITVAFPIALLVGRLSYARRVRPLLAARVPRYAGAPMRCRACGGDLAGERSEIVTCRYCRTPNLLSQPVAAEAARRLDEELAGYRARATGMMTATSHAGSRMTRTLFIVFALVYAGIFVLGAAARVVLAS